jgi:hypothetical protein
MNKYLTKQLAAIDLAIDALEDIRRRRHAMGEVAFHKGHDFIFAEKGHANYTKYTQAIQELEDLKEILTDPGVTVEAEQPRLL